MRARTCRPFASLALLLALALGAVGCWSVQVHAFAETAGSETVPAAAQVYTIGDESAASRFDAREQGWIGSRVRLQDPWGSCWAIAAVQAMEANLAKQGVLAKNDLLSERQLLWAAGTPVSTDMALNDSGVQAGQLAAQAGEGQHPVDLLSTVYGKNAFMEIGGNYYVVYQTVASGRGPVAYQSAPYRNEEQSVDPSGTSYAVDGTWSLDASKVFAAPYQLRNVQVLPTPAHYDVLDDVTSYSFDAEALAAVKQAITTYGSVTIAYDERFYDAQNNTAFTDDSLGNNHGVQIVGWDDSIARERFTTGTSDIPEGDGAWIVRNSWGAANQEFPLRGDFGENGYFYLSYYDRSAQMFAAYDMIAPAQGQATSIINQHDFLGQMSQASARVASSGLPLLAANVFTAESNQHLKAVSVDTYEPHTKVVTWLYLLDDGAADPQAGTFDPTKGTLLERKETTIDYAGYHRIELNESHEVKKGQRFAVVQSVTEPADDGEDTPVASLEAGNSQQAAERYSYQHYDTVVVNAGESFMYASLDGSDPVWMDAIEVGRFLTEESGINTPYGNVCIKVFADAANDSEPEPKPKPDSKTDPQDKGTQGNPVDEVSAGKTGTGSGIKVVPTVGKQAVGPAASALKASTGDALNKGALLLSFGLVLLLLAGLFAFKLFDVFHAQPLFGRDGRP